MLHSARKPEEFNPKLLAGEFTPALVTEFQPERNPDDDCSSDYLRIHGQYQDLFLAYAYGIEVLNEIRRIGINAITAEMVITWIKESYRLIAQHLLEGSPAPSGEYTPIQSSRWHWGGPTEKNDSKIKIIKN